MGHLPDSLSSCRSRGGSKGGRLELQRPRDYSNSTILLCDTGSNLLFQRAPLIYLVVGELHVTSNRDVLHASFRTMHIVRGTM
jgi:hypothetical protein